MGKLLLSSNIEVDSIEYNFDAGANEPLVIREWGRNIPVIKIGNEIITHGDLMYFSYSNRINDLPSIEITILDDDDRIKRLLKNEIDKGVIRMGYKDWALKFNCIYNNTTSSIHSPVITLNATIWNEKFYSDINNQYSYKDKTVQEVLVEVCKKCGMGLYVYENNYLSQVKHEYIINFGMNPLEFMAYIIRKYTNNIFSFDGNYFLHVGDIETIRKEKVANYTMNWKTGESQEEKPMIFKSATQLTEHQDENTDKIYISAYTIHSNFSEKFKKLKKEYQLWNENEMISLKQKDFGIGSEGCNTFSGFKDYTFPFYNEMVEKYISGNVIDVSTDFLIPELNPFDVINLELYEPTRHEREAKIDEYHSGDKIVIGFEIEYSKPSEKAQSLYKQKIKSI